MGNSFLMRFCVGRVRTCTEPISTYLEVPSYDYYDVYIWGGGDGPNFRYCVNTDSR